MQSEKYKFMQMALLEAQKGLGLVSPNPLVGAVIVKHGKVIGKGHHRKFGCDHAEIDALKNCSEDPEGAELYSNLEPCCHTNKKTPPCVPAIINAGIKKVFISNIDPNPAVSGKGVALLKEQGVEVETGILNELGEKLNEVFFHNMENKMPFIHLKAAQTLDGSLHSSTGNSKWISCEESRIDSHRLRLKYDAIMIGRETLNNDNPRLDIRMGVDSKEKIPFRIILGDPSRFNWDSEVFKRDRDKNIYLRTSESALDRHQESILAEGKVFEASDLKGSLENLFKMGIGSILVEGGPGVHSSFIEQGLFDRLTLYIAPKLLGNGKGVFTSSFETISESVNLKVLNLFCIGTDIKVELGK